MTLRKLLLPLALLAGALGAATPATAAISEIAALGENKPGCPGFEANDCRIVLVRQTGFQAKVGTTKNFTTAPSSGHLVAWTLPLASVSASQVSDVNSRYGGSPKVALVVLAPLGKSVFKVVQKGPLVDVTKYLGTTPTFALPTALPVKKGQIVGITVPTWAPVIQLGLGSDTSWRSTRPLKDAVQENFASQRALVGNATQASFAALYQRARLAYSATFVPTPTPAKTTTTKTTTKKK
ncbi:MAG: hypothetical protein J7513_03215 [Solirubrobacteraceae bacterium]|nr:hypothetical protein [Solirubrobacteraceae bacterium]